MPRCSCRSSWVKKSGSPSERAPCVAECAMLLDVLVVRLQRGTVVLQPLLGFAPPDRFFESRLEHPGQIEAQAPRALEQAMVDAQFHRPLVPARARGALRCWSFHVRLEIGA